MSTELATTAAQAFGYGLSAIVGLFGLKKLGPKLLEHLGGSNGKHCGFNELHGANLTGVAASMQGAAKDLAVITEQLRHISNSMEQVVAKL